MKHKIKIIVGDDLEAQVEKFCESVGFDNVIHINHSDSPGEGISVMIHYKSEN